MIYLKTFHLMYQNLSTIDALASVKYLSKNKNRLIKNFLIKYQFKNINFLFFDSARKCLSFILENIKLNNFDKNEILVPSFTCEVVPAYVLKNKYIPIYYDLCPETKGILNVIKKKVCNKTRAIIYQHSFGRHDNISELVKYCKKKNIFLIEDKALCFLSKKKNIPELQGDFAYYSFEASKTITTRMGGMLIFNNKQKFNVSYQNNFYYNFMSDLRTILSIITYNIQGYFGFGIRKILIILNLLGKSINDKDLIFKNKSQHAYYDLTNFQKCLIIIQFKNLMKKEICKKNIKFWKNILPDLDIEEFKMYSLFLPVRLSYNGVYSNNLKKKMRSLGMMQEIWFDGGVGSKNFASSKLNFKLNNFKITKQFCKNYINLPTLINLNKNFRNKIKLTLNS
jgi:dTDP-4-amino-4,6-dideoxygalactose transaminase